MRTAILSLVPSGNGITTLVTVMNTPRGLFVGLTTLDLIYHAPSPPTANEKTVAQSMTMTAGGPATNAAIAFAALGGDATLISVVGLHPLSQLIYQDLEQHQVQHLELMPSRIDAPTISSIVVSTETGDRAVISHNAQNYHITTHGQTDLPFTSLLESADIIVFDGHQMALSQFFASQAAEHQIPTVFDGGSWKPGSEKLLPNLTHIICSEAFSPPACGNESETLDYLRECNPQANLAITHGSDPITAVSPTHRHAFPCPSITPVDTLGAGDFFHGAFAYWITQKSFEASIQAASTIASLSCQFRGTRQWLSKISADHYPL